MLSQVYTDCSAVAEYRTPLYLMFIASEETFDSINRLSMWKAMRTFGILQKTANIKKDNYEDFTCRVLLNSSRLSEHLEMRSGVKQGL